MLELYRWSAMDAGTRVFGVLGDPVRHSMGPRLFNPWFADAGINAVYLPLLVSREGDCLERFLLGCRRRRWLDIGGFSVTLPHKAAVLHSTTISADRMALSIGAINTLVFQGDEMKGYNTDCHAAIDSLANALGREPRDLSQMTFDVLGTGGAARAILAGLQSFGCPVTVYGRSPQRTAEISAAFSCTPAPWNQRTKRNGEILINCTNVGLGPAVDDSPMPEGSFKGCHLVFDLIYHPLETKLLRQAARAGALVLNGLDMFVRQAAMQFELWTSQTPDRSIAVERVTRALALRTTEPSP